jgi:hypothetical protein
MARAEGWIHRLSVSAGGVIAYATPCVSLEREAPLGIDTVRRRAAR